MRTMSYLCCALLMTVSQGGHLDKFRSYREASLEFFEPGEHLHAKHHVKRFAQKKDFEASHEVYARLSPLNLSLRLEVDASFFDKSHKEVTYSENGTVTVGKSGPPTCY